METSWFSELNKVYLRRRALVEKLATRLGAKFEPNSVGLFVWAKLPEEVSDSEAFVDKILNDKHVFITPGTIFGSHGEGYIRFSLCVNEHTIEEVLKRFES
jgi:aspartate/methionine/tyrosine aminotransferase